MAEVTDTVCVVVQLLLHKVHAQYMNGLYMTEVHVLCSKDTHKQLAQMFFCVHFTLTT